MEGAKREGIYREIFESGKYRKGKFAEENHILKLRMGSGEGRVHRVSRYIIRKDGCHDQGRIEK